MNPDWFFSTAIFLFGVVGSQPDLSSAWEVTSFSNAGDATAFTPVPRSDDEPSVRFLCSGNPPSFEANLLARHDAVPGFADGEPPFWGRIRFGTGPSRSALWYPRYGFTTPAERSEIESLRMDAASLFVEVVANDEEPFRGEVRLPGGFPESVGLFLEACDRHVRHVHRTFEIDGIRVELKVEVDERGIADLRALAGDFGIRDVESIYVGLTGLPTSWLAAVVRSEAEKHGDVVEQKELYLRNRYWLTSWVAPDEDLTSRGEWQTSSSHLRSLDRWVVRDEDFETEVRLGDGVSYDAAIRIVRAIRRDLLVDVRAGLQLFEGPISTGPGDFSRFGDAIPEIRLTSRWPTDTPGPLYEVSLPDSAGSGTLLAVRIVGDTVELVGVGQWIV